MASSPASERGQLSALVIRVVDDAYTGARSGRGANRLRIRTDNNDDVVESGIE